MKKKVSAATALILMFASPAVAQVGQSSDSLSRLKRPAPPPSAQMSPQATVEVAKQRIEADKKAGRAPDRKTLQLLLSAQSQLKDEAGMADTLEELATGYDDPADWSEIIAITFGTPGLRDQDQIWLGRLLFVVGAQVPPTDASTVGQLASQHGFFGDAVNAKAHGGQVEPDPAPRADSDKKSMPDQIAQEQAQDGAYNAKLAEALYGYGMYREAEAAAKQATQKGGNPDPSEAPMVLGQALTAQGKYDDAVLAFGQVKGGGPVTPRIARLWAGYAKIKKRG
jgi:tetratricopeptide (TPR) repeat protein